MIKVENLKMDFKSELNAGVQHVLKGLSFGVEEGDCLAILGESGSGKSTLGRILIGLLKPTSGKYSFLGTEPYHDRKSKKVLAKNISIVFQDYNTSVNPRFTVREIVREAIDVVNGRISKSVERESKIIEYMQAVGLDETYLDRFPHQLSGGQLQRVCIARALASEPRIILFDEAISSLDAHTQVKIMDLLIGLRQKYKLTYIFITHDLTSVTYMCNKVMFLYQGRITEMIHVSDINNTTDEYAIKLLNAVIEV